MQPVTNGPGGSYQIHFSAWNLGQGAQASAPLEFCNGTVYLYLFYNVANHSFLLVLVKSTLNMAEECNPIDQALEWIGFNQGAQRDAILEEGFNELTDLFDIKEKDIETMAASFAKRTINDGRIVFGLRRIKLMKSLVHWAQDFRRCSEEPTIEGMD